MIKIGSIGEGTYGRVYEAESRKTGDKYAVKRNLIEKQLDFAGSIRELDILHMLQNHPHIVNIKYMSIGDPFIRSNMSPIDDDFKDDKIHFIFELADEDLGDLIYDRAYDYNEAKMFMIQILLGLEYMHSKHIMHRDMKPKNVLIFNGVMKICDFGLSKPINFGPHSPRVVTSRYRAPELTMLDRYYSKKIDIWSIGCIMYELITGAQFINNSIDDNLVVLNGILNKLPTKVDAEVLSKMTKRGHVRGKIRQNSRKKTWERQLFQDGETEIPESFDKKLFVDLLSHALEFDPDQRWSATELLNHSFFDDQRVYINKIREDFPPEEDPLDSIKCVHCNERIWAVRIVYDVFNDRDKNDWYDHCIIFQAIDMYDRYLLYLDSTSKKRNRQNRERGMFLDKYTARLHFFVCLYLAIKFYAGNTYPVHFFEVVHRKYRTREAKIMADDFEDNLIKNYLGYRIHRKTVYDMADRKLNDDDIISLLYIIGDLQKLDQNLTIVQLYECFLQASKPEPKE